MVPTELKFEDSSGFKNFTRTSPTDVEVILQMSAPRIIKRETRFRSAISPTSPCRLLPEMSADIVSCNPFVMDHGKHKGNMGNSCPTVSETSARNMLANDLWSVGKHLEGTGRILHPCNGEVKVPGKQGIQFEAILKYLNTRLNRAAALDWCTKHSHLDDVDNVVVTGTVQEVDSASAALWEVVSNHLRALSSVHVADSDADVEGRAQRDDMDVVALLVHRFHLLGTTGGLDQGSCLRWV
uniref:Uncharacterized protein n=1 Tax=Timema poppense TaxID=170557 RepID=A0A7R9H9N9_TIMPO|nr:unnamed protein product [Timema poppensis]